MRHIVLACAAIAAALTLSIGAAKADDSAIAEQIAGRLRDLKLQQELKDFRINLKVEKGVVWVGGNVAETQHQDLALDTARRVPGVKLVVNDLTVTGKSSVAKNAHQANSTASVPKRPPAASVPPTNPGEASAALAGAANAMIRSYSQVGRAVASLDGQQFASRPSGAHEIAPDQGGPTAYGYPPASQRPTYQQPAYSQGLDPRTAPNQPMRAPMPPQQRYRPQMQPAPQRGPVRIGGTAKIPNYSRDQRARLAGATQLASCANGSCGNGGSYSDGGYGEGCYSDGGYSDGGYSGDGCYSDGGYDGGYGDGGYSDGGYGGGGYSDGGYGGGNSGPMPMASNGGQPAMQNEPSMPCYAWPSYAAHPNYAGVSYPKQYSATAWPYIGPFYPYPQVPLGWRKVALEWDDGWWNLDFSCK